MSICIGWVNQRDARSQFPWPWWWGHTASEWHPWYFFIAPPKLSIRTSSLLQAFNVLQAWGSISQSLLLSFSFFSLLGLWSGVLKDAFSFRGRRFKLFGVGAARGSPTTFSVDVLYARYWLLQVFWCLWPIRIRLLSTWLVRMIIILFLGRLPGRNTFLWCHSCLRGRPLLICLIN